jgi:hypothetical protein
MCATSTEAAIACISQGSRELLVPRVKKRPRTEDDGGSIAEKSTRMLLLRLIKIVSVWLEKLGDFGCC